jgi:hypothetical protein
MVFLNFNPHFLITLFLLLFGIPNKKKNIANNKNKVPGTIGNKKPMTASTIKMTPKINDIALKIIST